MAVLGASSLQIDSATLGSQSGSAPMFAARAWVNFNGTGTVAIRASGNVSSITDNGVGNYTVNFATAMPDTSYAAFIGTANWTGNANYGHTLPTAGDIGLRTRSGSTFTDYEHVYFAIFL
jgi:hypothetical protein